MKDRIGLLDVVSWADGITTTEGTEVQASEKSIAVAHAILEAIAEAHGRRSRTVQPLVGRQNQEEA